MKKIKLIAPILGLTTAATLGSTLVSCGPDTPAEEPTFTVANALSTNRAVAEIELDWTPGDHSIEFEGTPTFTTTKANVGKVTIIQESRPLKLQIAFNEAVKTDITDGALSFTYNNKTTKQTKVEGKVENIKISFCDYLLNEWSMDKLVLKDVTFEAGKQYKVMVDTSKFEDEFGTHPQLKLTDTTYDASIGCDVYYDGRQLSFTNPTEYICPNDGSDLVCFLAETITLEKGKELYYIISIPNGTANKTLYFENR